jgi:hypothetical protein
MREDIHACNGLDQHRKNAYDMPETGANHAEVDAIEKHKGVWVLMVNAFEYSVRINFCPFCGKRLR